MQKSDTYDNAGSTSKFATQSLMRNACCLRLQVISLAPAGQHLRQSKVSQAAKAQQYSFAVLCSADSLRQWVACESTLPSVMAEP